ncbi:SAM hydrolase/SAM-dependent halogenase family protein [Endothiovibrio diazotrophicus]
MQSIVLFTDFGIEGPYLGQMKAVLYRGAPALPVIDLFVDAPSYDPRCSAYLLAPYAEWFPAGTVFLCVVDPGVGSERRAAVVGADGRWFVGPDNGLLNEVARRATAVRWWDIEWRPEQLSSSFHGRDLFAPVAVRLALDEAPPGREVAAVERVRGDWPVRWPRVVYIDHYGNAITGLRASEVDPAAHLRVAGRCVERARIFSDVLPEVPFWYENSNGLVEVAVNRGRADRHFGLSIGDPVEVEG